jgi:nitroreductase
MNESRKTEAVRTIENVWSCHGNFTDREISGAALETILAAAVRAATASAQQSYSIIVIDDRATMKKLTGYAGSRALVFCADGTRLSAAAKRLHLESCEDFDMNAFITWSVDTLLAAQNACIAARSLGIDSLFTNGIVRTGLDEAFETLGLPAKGCFPLITLVLGYASSAPEKRKGRLSGAGVVHRGRYAPLDEGGLGGMIAAYDDPHLNLGMGQAFVAKGYAHYLEWFYKDWMAGFPKDSGDAVAARLRRSGFLK